MDTNTSCIVFDECDFIVDKDIEATISDSGKLLNISVCLKNIDICKDLIVGVLVCYNHKPYALETREIFTDCSCKYCPCCCCNVNDICIGGFHFIFPSKICKQDITVKIIAHYTI